MHILYTLNINIYVKHEIGPPHLITFPEYMIANCMTGVKTKLSLILLMVLADLTRPLP